MASTSLLVHPKRTKHDVFLSYKGKDTRTNFIGHLLAAFTRNSIDAFIDDEVGGGEGVSETILTKLSESLVSVVVFSPNYADSPYCLDELVKIIESRDSMGQMVLPVFLGVEPTHVRSQTGAFGGGFNMLIQDHNFKNKEETWRHALAEIAILSGWDSKQKSQDKIVEEIVNRIEKKLDQACLDDQCDGFIGISRVEKVESMLRIESSERVRSIGIWGMGGIGKTTIAKHVYYRLSYRFDEACFIENVSAKAERDGLDGIQKDMIFQLGLRSAEMGPYMFSPMVQRRLKRKRVLIVLDNVVKAQHLKILLGRDDIYCPGSRIIVTSRDMQVLKNGCKELYEVEKLNQRESFMLLNLHAFKNDQPTKELLELSRKAVLYADGLPLALEVLGCNLCGMDLIEWEIELAKLEKIPNIEVTDILKISYEGLEDKEKQIFLDIACIFHGWDKDQIERILDACGFYAVWGIGRLRDKALISFSNNTVEMHDLVQEMGQDIVFHECIEEPSKRSRLWRSEDIFQVLTELQGAKMTEVISLDLSRVKDLRLKPKVFETMTRLRVLHFENHFPLDYKIILPKGLKYIPDKLRYFRWDHFPLPYLPPKLHLEHLVELRMKYSHLKQLWDKEVEPNLPNLKYIDLESSYKLIRLPNFKKVINLQELHISECTSLKEVPSSIQHLVELKHFLASDNKNLRRIPECSHLTKLEILSLIDCSKITKLPEIPPSIISLRLSATALKKLPSSFGSLTQLQNLDLSQCKRLQSVPNSIGELKLINELNLHGCVKLSSLPEDLGNLKSMKLLNVDETSIRSLPDSICNLTSLKTLRAQHCWNLEKLPENLGALKSLVELLTNDSPLKSLPSSINHLTSLEYLSCQGYRGNALPSLADLHSPNIGIGNRQVLGLLSLKEMDFRGSDLKSLPESIKYLSELKKLYLSGCMHLSCLTEVPSGLEYLEATKCTSLEHIHSLFGEADQELPAFLNFDFVDCFNLEGCARNQMMTDFWLRIRRTVQHRFDKELYTRSRICIPGNEVPEWFEYSAIGSSLQVKTNNMRRLAKGLLGFCVVVDVAPKMYFVVKCKCLTESGEEFVSHSSYIFPDCDDLFQSEHLFLWYFCVENKSLSFPCFSCDATFEFYAVDYLARQIDGFKILRCGVTPMVKDC